MNRRRILAALVAVALVALAAWTYSSGSVDVVGAVAGPAPATTQPSSGGPLTTVARPSTKKPTPTTAPAPTTTVAPNPAAYSAALFGFWKQRDRDGANTIATAAVVQLLFSQRWHAADGWVTQPCRSALGSTYCVWARPGRKYVFQVRNPSGGRPPQVIGLQKTN